MSAFPERIAEELAAAREEMKRDNDAAERAHKERVDYWRAADTCRDLRDIIDGMTIAELLALHCALKAGDHCELGRVICRAWDDWFYEAAQADRLEDE